jgi:hypothetical protein
MHKPSPTTNVRKLIYKKIKSLPIIGYLVTCDNSESQIQTNMTKGNNFESDKSSKTLKTKRGKCFALGSSLVNRK